MNWVPIIVFSLVALFAVVLYAAISYEAKRRRERIKNLADGLGLEFQAETSAEQLDLFKQVSYFNRGHSHQVLNHLSGSTDVATIHVLDFHYTVSGGKSSTVFRQTVVALVSDELAVPGFDLAPETIFTRFTEWFGVQDIDFAAHEEFSKKFMLQANNADGVRQLMDRELMDFFCRKPDIYLSVRQGFLCVYRPNQLAPPEQWKDRMAEGFEIYRQILDRMTRVG
jgi:hypothetical protein